jgi:L-ascorbate metabolism protein UlaG (beta-lactamase superfamily)
MISLIYSRRALPIYWTILNKGDREFHSIELATWLKKEKQKRKNKIDFALRQKQGTFYHRGDKKYEKLSDIEIERGVKQIYKD